MALLQRHARAPQLSWPPIGRMVALLLISAGLNVQANDRPFESARTAVAEDDDQVWSFETWTRQLGKQRSLTVEADYSFNPATSLQLELTRHLGGPGQDSGQEAEIEAKHVFNRLERDGWGWGASVALGTERSTERSTERRAGHSSSVQALSLRLPVSLDLGALSGWMGSGSLLHLNVGVYKSSETRRSASNAVAIEQRLFRRSVLFAEWSRQGPEQLAQGGLRHWLQRDRLALDLAWQQRRADGERRAGWVLGLGWYDL